MLNLDQIKQYYPSHLQVFGSFLLREYLQYKILVLLFRSAYADKFAFLGGTCLRIVHQSNRFSEDLDFDNFGITPDEFDQVAALIKTELEKDGYEVEVENVYRGAYHCYIKFPHLLHNAQLSGHRQAKILIQLDTEPQGFEFTAETKLLNQFDVFGTIKTTPIDLLLAQKITAFCFRKQPKGRDLYDITFLQPLTKPNYAYLQKELGVSNQTELKDRLYLRLSELSLPALAKDVEPFLFFRSDTQRVLLFQEFVQGANF
jgi:predicted nucleotidyltransferase component of viral defense system